MSSDFRMVFVCSPGLLFLFHFTLHISSFFALLVDLTCYLPQPDPIRGEGGGVASGLFKSSSCYFILLVLKSQEKPLNMRFYLK